MLSGVTQQMGGGVRVHTAAPCICSLQLSAPICEDALSFYSSSCECHPSRLGLDRLAAHLSCGQGQKGRMGKAEANDQITLERKDVICARCANLFLQP